MKQKIKYRDIRENRKYKDTLFRTIFQNKEDLLELYNAVNQTDYTDVSGLEINTLENVVYMSYKNDVSFLIGCTLNLYEHQSTHNENMPLLNINYGHNRELMERCRRLEEYAIFVSRVRRYMDEGKQTLKEAINRAIDECIEENILRDILTKNRNEVLGMVLTTFNKGCMRRC